MQTRDKNANLIFLNPLLEVFAESKDNLFHSFQRPFLETQSMNGLTGMEKFSHLEDKIYLTIEFAKKMREERDRLESEINSLRRQATEAAAERDSAEAKLAVLLSERDSIQLKVEAMLDAITLIDTDAAEAVGR